MLNYLHIYLDQLGLRKDRYNKKLNKFYVVYEEGDENLSEDEEIERQDDVQAPLPACWMFLQFHQSTLVFPLPTATPAGAGC